MVFPKGNDAMNEISYFVGGEYYEMHLNYLILSNREWESRGNFWTDNGALTRGSTESFSVFICSEGLSSLMRLTLRDGLIKDAKIVKEALHFRIYYLSMIVFYLGKQVKGNQKF